MTNLFTRLPITVSDPSLSVVPFTNVDYLGDAEMEAYGHWIFSGGSSSCLTSVNNTKALTAEGTVSYQSNHVLMSSAAGNALVTDRPDPSPQNVTICMVIKNPVIGAHRRNLYGNSNDTNGFAIRLASTVTPGGLSVEYEGNAQYVTSLIPGADQWVFLAVANAGAERIHYMGGSSPVLASTSGNYTAPTTSPVRSPGFGNRASSASLGTVADVGYAEGIIFDWKMTAAELDVVYARSKARLARRGITVV